MRTVLAMAGACLLFVLSLPGMTWKTYGFYRTIWSEYRSSLFNPNNRSVERLGMTCGPHFLFSQFLSLQAEGMSLSWQFDFRGEAAHKNRDGWQSDLTINQFYIQKDFLDNWIFIAGRSIQKWGTGFAFNPTDVVAPEKELSDPDNLERRAVGNDMFQIEYFGASFSLAMCFLTRLETGSAIKTKDPRLAFRIYKNIWDIDMSLIALSTGRETPLWGFNFSGVIGDCLEIHGEVSAQKGSYRKYHPAATGMFVLYTADPLKEFKRNDQKIYCQYLAGFQYTFPGNVLWVAEYYHRDKGYSRKEWRRIIAYAKFLNTQKEAEPKLLAEGNLLWLLNVYSPKGAMKDYLMNHINIPLSAKWHLQSTCLLNLADLSLVCIPEIVFQTGKHFTLYARSFIFQGRKETEFGEFKQSYSLETGLRFQR